MIQKVKPGDIITAEWANSVADEATQLRATVEGLPGGDVQALTEKVNDLQAAFVSLSETVDGLSAANPQPPKRELITINTTNTEATAQQQLATALEKYHTTIADVVELPFDLYVTGPGKAENIFFNASNLEVIPYLKMDRVRNTSLMFGNCRKLREITNAEIDTSQCLVMTSMFLNCVGLINADKLGLDTGAATNLMRMFKGCTNLTHVGTLDTGKATNMQEMFDGCTSLKDGAVTLTTKLEGANTTNMIRGSGLTTEPFQKV